MLLERVDRIQEKTDTEIEYLTLEDFQEFAEAVQKQVLKVQHEYRKQLESKADTIQLNLAEKAITEVESKLNRLMTNLAELEVVDDS